MSQLAEEPRTSYGEQRSPQQKLYDAAVLERVKNGVALLEREYGPSWVDRIDLKTLDLTDGSVCVLGQVYADKGDPDGEWRNGFYYAVYSGHLEGLNKWNSENFGFVTPGLEDCDEEWDALQQAWEDVLTPMVVKS